MSGLHSYRIEERIAMSAAALRHGQRPCCLSHARESVAIRQQGFQFPCGMFRSEPAVREVHPRPPRCSKANALCVW